MNAQLYREGSMQAAAEEGLVVLAHCEDISMVHGGVMNADAKANELGLQALRTLWRRYCGAGYPAGPRDRSTLRI